MKGIEQDEGKIKAAFLNPQNIVKFIEDLESLKEKTGVELTLKSVTLSEEMTYSEPRFQFQISGAFRDLFQYLVLLENLPYQINFGRVQFTATREETKKTGIWQAEIEIILLSYEKS